MSKDYDDDYDDEYDERGGNKDYYDYDDEISRKAVGKLLNGLDDNKRPSKPTVKAIRTEPAGERRKSSINTSYYDESRTSRYEDDDDEIVTGFRDDDDYYDSADDDYEDDNEQMELEELREMEEESEPVKSRRARPGSEETPADRQERERYRRQFLDGYTDTRRKGSDTAQTADHRRRPAGASADDAVRRIAAEKEKAQEDRESAPRRRPRPTGGEARPQPPQTRGSRSSGPVEHENDDEISIIPKRGERRKERTPAAPVPSYGGTSAAPSYDAPIFKIIILAFVVMLFVMVFLVFKINGANKTIAEHEKNIELAQADAETLTNLQTANDGYKQQIAELKGEKGDLELRVQSLEAQIAEMQGPPSGNSQPSATGQTTTPQTSLPGGAQTYTVVSGDSLSRISNRFLGDSSRENIEAIKKANNMTSDGIAVGQTLVIPPRQ